MKIKFLFLAMAMTVASSASAQFVGSGKGSSSGGGLSYESAYEEQKKFTNELDFYIQDGWGLGYQLRKDFNPYVGWNIFGVSYMSGFASPADYGQVNFKFLGVRGYTPAYKTIRGYVDLNLGYTLSYVDIGWRDSDIVTSHNFGLDFSVGIQLHKNFAIGYNLNFLAPDKAKSHWARIAYIF